MTDAELRELARAGALLRVLEIVKEFPELDIRVAVTDNGAARPRRSARRRMSAAARKAVSDRMRQYWARRRKAKK